MTHEQQNRVLDFWFGSDPLKPLANKDLWFTKNPAFDEQIRSLFEAQVQQAKSGAFDDWAQTPRGSLALLILLDQFPRNIYRDQSAAFESDPKARKIAETAIARGFDEELSPIERCFMYLPLEHAEDLAAQETSVELFKSLAKKAEPDLRAMTQVTLDYAVRHRDVIKKFGRFPHRNSILNRVSTKAEVDFLATPNSSF